VGCLHSDRSKTEYNEFLVSLVFILWAQANETQVAPGCHTKCAIQVCYRKARPLYLNLRPQLEAELQFQWNVMALPHIRYSSAWAGTFGELMKLSLELISLYSYISYAGQIIIISHGISEDLYLHQYNRNNG